MWYKEVGMAPGIDSFSYHYTLTPKQKSNIIENLKELPKFYTITNNYSQNTYAYLSDCFADEGVKVWVCRKNGKPWNLLIVVHPMLVLGDSDRSALYQPREESKYQKIVGKVDSLLKSVDVPCSIDTMKLYRVDATANLIAEEKTLAGEYLRILKKSSQLPHYQLDYFREEEHKARNCKLANEHSYKQYCKSAAFFAYDKTAQLEMVNAFPDALMGKCVLRLEAQLRRKAMKKWVGKNGMDGSNWSIIKKLGQKTEKILRWYLDRLLPANTSYVRYQAAVDMVKTAKGRKMRERMLYLLRKTSDSASVTVAIEKLMEKYELSKSQCRTVLKKFEKLGISPITLRNSADYDELPPLFL